jgi:hypothetical protein
MASESPRKTFTAEPFATVRVDGDAADLIDDVLSALERDDRVIAPALSYDYEKQQIEATFQVEPDDESAETAARLASAAFNDALAAAHADAISFGVSIVD